MNEEANRRHEKYERLIARLRALPPIVTAVAHPCDETSLTGTVEAAEAGIITPILVGPLAKIRALAEQLGFDLTPFRLVDQPYSHAAAAKAVELVRMGEAAAQGQPAHRRGHGCRRQARHRHPHRAAG